MVTVRALLIALLAVTLAGCPKPTPEPVEPGDPSAVLTGEWFGVLHSSEGFFVNVLLTLDERDGVVTGAAVFPDERAPTTGVVTGARDAGLVTLTVSTTDGFEVVTFTLTGAISGDALTGRVTGLLGTDGAFALGRSP